MSDASEGNGDGRVSAEKRSIRLKVLRRCALAGTSASPQNASTGVSGFIDFPAARRVSGLVQFFTGQFLICTQTPAGLDAAPPNLLPWPPKTTNVLYGVGSKPWNF